MQAVPSAVVVVDPSEVRARSWKSRQLPVRRYIVCSIFLKVGSTWIGSGIYRFRALQVLLDVDRFLVFVCLPPSSSLLPVSVNLLCRIGCRAIVCRNSLENCTRWKRFWEGETIALGTQLQQRTHSSSDNNLVAEIWPTVAVPKRLRSNFNLFVVSLITPLVQQKKESELRWTLDQRLNEVFTLPEVVSAIIYPMLCWLRP